jgi:hypothetical protein
MQFIDEYKQALTFCESMGDKGVLGFESMSKKEKRGVIKATKKLSNLPTKMKRSIKFSVDYDSIVSPDWSGYKLDALFHLPYPLMTLVVGIQEGYVTVCILELLGNKKLSLCAFYLAEGSILPKVYTLTIKADAVDVSYLIRGDSPEDEKGRLSALTGVLCFVLQALEHSDSVGLISKRESRLVGTAEVEQNREDTFNTIKISPDTGRIHYNSGSIKTGRTNRFHEVRGHYRHYKKPIKSGKNKGEMRVFIQDHTAGDISKGRVYKDYEIIGDKEDGTSDNEG